MKRSSLLGLLLALATTMLAAQAALAHSFIDHCTPDLGSSLALPPAQITCVFTEGVDARQTKFTVTDAGNNRVDNNDLKSDPNDNKGLTVIITLNTAKITGGVYTVKWSTVSADGDPTDGQWQFSVNAQPAPAIALVSPTDSSTFPTDPSDVPVSVKVSNFALGQGGRRWQVYLDGNLITQVTDGSTSTTLKAVKKGDYALKVALATDDQTIVATAGVPLSVGPADTTTAPSTTQPNTPSSTQATTPATLPKTGEGRSPDLTFALLLGVAGLLLLAAGRVARGSH